MGNRDATAAELQPLAPPPAAPAVLAAFARGLAPRKALKVSEWADRNRRLSSKGSAEAGQWRTSRNELLREPMDCFSTRSSVREVALQFPIQLGKTEVALNVLGYTMCENPGPIMTCLPGEVSMGKWVQQKLQPMIDESPAVKETLTSVASREASNTRTFKDFAGGQLYLEHAGSPSRLKSTSVRTLIVDELDEFAANLVGGDDPAAMLEGRTSAFPGTSKRLYISSPQTLGTSRINAKYLASDQRHRYLPCPHCQAMQPLEWAGLKWESHRPLDRPRRAWYVCRECGAEIDEHHKPDMLARGQWIAHNPGAPVRGYHANCLYYPIGLGPRWSDLVEMWLDAQNDPAKLKTFVNDRLAEPWEDTTTRRVKHNAIADRAETYALRTAPAGVLVVTAGVDTQDNRLAAQIVGWGRGMAFWVLDYVELMGDPANDEVWDALTALLTAPILHASGAVLHVQAYSQDIAGHRTEAVKAYIRDARRRGVRRPMASFGAVAANAPVLGKPKLADVDWRGRLDKRGVHIHQIGTVNAKHWLYGRLSLDADTDAKHLQALQAEEAAARSEGRATASVDAPRRLCHFSRDLPEMYFPGLVSEVFNPAKNRFDHKRGVRNEPLDTWVHAFVAAHHPELRLHRATAADWDRREAELRDAAAQAAAGGSGAVSPPALAAPAAPPARADTLPAARASISPAPTGNPRPASSFGRAW